ncbi:TetR/AcrR family transcriptional regulator [Maridesulfovibrio sp. FT414]|uniref:TetR/AcrR family transcriptional regulator n=1 Tax=Maridesulfovibrio sp. FT414 TaxID=2979469 RepID=UPI003D80634C
MTMLNEKGSRKRSNSMEELLDAGIRILETDSIQYLTIDALCKQLGVTKGSFYHHFRSRDDYLKRMLEHWVQVCTLARMEIADRGNDAAERFRMIVEASNSLPAGSETSIRAWALRDPLPREFLERVDGIRMDYLTSIFEEVCGDPDRARLLSRISYSLFVGTRMVVPAISGQERDDLIRLVQNELYGIPERK